MEFTKAFRSKVLAKNDLFLAVLAGTVGHLDHLMNNSL